MNRRAEAQAKRRADKERRAKVAAAEAAYLAVMTPQERQVHESAQKHAERLLPRAEDRNRRYDEF